MTTMTDLLVQLDSIIEAMREAHEAGDSARAMSLSEDYWHLADEIDAYPELVTAEPL